VNENQAITLVTRLVCRFRHLDASQVPPDADLPGTLGFDSLDAAELLAAIHSETGRELDINSLRQLRTIADIAGHLAGTAPAATEEAAVR
jgi:acyl carrier protein